MTTHTEPVSEQVNELVIYNDVKISGVQVKELITSSGLAEDEIVRRLRNIYTQTEKPLDNIIERFVENNYDTLDTIKSFYQFRLVNTQNGSQEPTSINQLRMRQIRSYMDSREKLRSNTRA